MKAINVKTFFPKLFFLGSQFYVFEKHGFLHGFRTKSSTFSAIILKFMKNWY